jgi:hypothetical protein
MSSYKAWITRNFGRAIGVLFLLFTPLIGRAQVVPEMRGPLSIHLFGHYTYGSSDWGANHSAGVTLGGFIQAPHIFGFETRGDYLRWGVQERRYDALVGPRVALHFSRFSPYGAVLGGAGHAVTWTTAVNSSFRSGTAGEWKLLGGVDFYAGHHFNLRLGEVSYAKIYVFHNGLSAIDVSGGVVYRLPVRER